MNSTLLTFPVLLTILASCPNAVSSAVNEDAAKGFSNRGKLLRGFADGFSRRAAGAPAVAAEIDWISKLPKLKQNGGALHRL